MWRTWQLHNFDWDMKYYNSYSPIKLYWIGSQRSIEEEWTPSCCNFHDGLIKWYCAVLCCVGLDWIVLYWIVLYCIVLYCMCITLERKDEWTPSDCHFHEGLINKAALCCLALYRIVLSVLVNCALLHIIRFSDYQRLKGR